MITFPEPLRGSKKTLELTINQNRKLNIGNDIFINFNKGIVKTK